VLNAVPDCYAVLTYAAPVHTRVSVAW